MTKCVDTGKESIGADKITGKGDNISYKYMIIKGVSNCFANIKVKIT